MRIDSNPTGIDIHDTVGGENISYGLDANGEPFGFSGYDRGGKHAGQAPAKLVAQSIRENLTNEKRLTSLLAKMDSTAYRGEQVLARIGRVRASTTGTLRALGTGGGGTVLGAVAIFGAVSGSAGAADKAWAYARDVRNGDSAYADLDAIDIAVSVQEATGNYFVTSFALDILLDHD